MPLICSILFLLFVSQATGQGFLRASNVTQGASREVKSSNTTSSGKGNVEADASTLLINDGSETLSRGSETQVQKAKGDDGGAVDTDSSDSDLRSNLQSEANFLKEELDEAGLDDQDSEDGDQDYSKETSDQLQNEVNRLQDKVDRSKADHSNSGDQDDGDDFTPTPQNEENDVQDESGKGKVQTTEPDEAHMMTMTTITHGRQGNDYNDTALLQHLAHWNQLLDEASASKIHAREDPDVITVLIQKLRKHASILGQGGEDYVSENSDEDDMQSDDEADEVDDANLDESFDDADDENLDGESLEESDEESSEEGTDTSDQVEDDVDDDSETESDADQFGEDTYDAEEVEQDSESSEDEDVHDAEGDENQDDEDEEFATEDEEVM